MDGSLQKRSIDADDVTETANQSTESQTASHVTDLKASEASYTDF